MMSKTRRSEKFRLNLRAVFYRDGAFWVAHCLEMDVMGHAKTQNQALSKMIEAVSLQIISSIESGNHSNIFMPADARFFEMYSVGKDTAQIDLIAERVMKQ